MAAATPMKRPLAPAPARAQAARTLTATAQATTTATTIQTTMTWAGSSNSNRRRACELAAFLGLVGAAADMPDLVAPPAAAQSETYRPADTVPSSWSDFAQQLQ